MGGDGVSMRTANCVRISSSVSFDLSRGGDKSLEMLESRRLLAVTAISAGGVLTVLGDNNANTIVISRDASGKLLVNNGSVNIAGASANVADIKFINVFGFAGRDSLSLDETNGALPAASLIGGDGRDTLTGGSGNDILLGG